MTPFQNLLLTLLSLVLILLVAHLFYCSPFIVYTGLVLSFLVLCLLVIVHDRAPLPPPFLVYWARPMLFILTATALVYWVVQLLAPVRGASGRLNFHRMDSYFERIRHNEAALTAFFSQMPKGGDLHNHFSGSIYTESFIEEAVRQKRHINIATMQLVEDPPSTAQPTGNTNKQAGKKKSKAPAVTPNPNILRIDTIINIKAYSWLRQRLMLEWSVKDYYDAFSPSDKHFFDAFGKFPYIDEAKGLWELTNRAKKEQVQYIELMTWGINAKQLTDTQYRREDSLLVAASHKQDMASLNRLFRQLYGLFDSTSRDSAQAYCRRLRQFHAGIDDQDFTMRYQANVRREKRPVEVFRDLIAAFEATVCDSLVVGVNIVNREDGRLSMRDYALHMKMFQFMRGLYKNTQCAMHAGELTIGTVRPEDLSWHINDAVYTAGARRIGHGVDIAYERSNLALLQHMREEKIAVEINLVSNEFILKVTNERHPVTLYAEHGVPIVICTDDAGILRTNHTEQFVLLALRYPVIRYYDMRQYILNSIEFSFIKEPALKARLLKQLEQDLSAYEDRVLSAQ